VGYLYRRAYEGFNYRLRTFADGRWADHCRPTSISLLLTNLCNARCVHCDIWKNKGKEAFPSLEQWKTFLSDLRNWLGPVQVTFTGGEALLQPYTPDVVAHASSIGLAAEVLTHGYWRDQSRIEKLAMANPWRVTLSLDGIGETHSKVRGRENFWETTTTSIETLKRLRAEHKLKYHIRLKTVLMEHNLQDAAAVAQYANQPGMHIFYQPVEQNYNTPEDPRWFETSANWPKDPERAVAAVQELIRLKRSGLPIDNSYEQLEVMIPYFRNPDSMRVTIQGHSAHEHRANCAALTTLQVNPNGDVLSCYGMPPVGNIKSDPIRGIWENRPHWWQEGCCLYRRCTPAEKETLSLVSLSE
jgi:MoaA/NifB/PqqE/SkfB family radical SAM enzyme